MIQSCNPVQCIQTAWFWFKYFFLSFYQVKGYTIVNGKELAEVDDLKGTNEDSKGLTEDPKGTSEGPKGTSEVVHAAVHALKKLCNDIKESAVTGKEVESYRKEANKLQILCEAANIGNTQLVPQFTEISEAIQECLDKLEVVKEYHSKLVVVVDYYNDISKSML